MQRVNLGDGVDWSFTKKLVPITPEEYLKEFEKLTFFSVRANKLW